MVVKSKIGNLRCSLHVYVCFGVGVVFGGWGRLLPKYLSWPVDDGSACRAMLEGGASVSYNASGKADGY